MKLLMKELPPLKDVGPQSCLAFSVDGSKLATGGVVRKNMLSIQSMFLFILIFLKNVVGYFDTK